MLVKEGMRALQESKDTFLESGPETNLHSNENTTLSTTFGPHLWDLPGFPGGAEKFLRAGLCEQEVGPPENST